MWGVSIGFAFGFFGSMPLTGPIAVLVFHRGVFGHYREGIAVAVGAAVAECVYCGLAVTGFSALFDAYPVLVPISKVVSVVILTALGLYFFVSARRRGDQLPTAPPGSGLWMRGLLQGFLIAGLNPVLIINWSASIALLYSISDIRFLGWDRLAFVSGVGLGIVGWFAVMLLLLRKYERRLSVRFFRITVQFMGIALMLMAIYVTIDLVRGML